MYFLGAALHFKSHESSSFMFETHFVYEFGEKQMTSEVRFYKLIKKNESSNFKAYGKSGGKCSTHIIYFLSYFTVSYEVR